MILADDPTLEMEVKLGYRDMDDGPSDWKLLAESVVTRKLGCTIEEEQVTSEFSSFLKLQKFKSFIKSTTLSTFILKIGF